jgi:hypothetical protein
MKGTREAGKMEKREEVFFFGAKKEPKKRKGNSYIRKNFIFVIDIRSMDSDTSEGEA